MLPPAHQLARLEECPPRAGLPAARPQRGGEATPAPPFGASKVVAAGGEVLLPEGSQAQELVEASFLEVFVAHERLRHHLFRDKESVCRFLVSFPSQPLELLRLAHQVVVLDAVTSATNLGQILRSAHYLGVSSFVVSKSTWSALNGRAAAISEGAMYHADFHRADDLPVALKALAGNRQLLAAEDFAARPVAKRRVEISGRWALVLGSEQHGISKEVLELCQAVRVPTLRGASLNVAATAAEFHNLQLAAKRVLAEPTKPKAKAAPESQTWLGEQLSLSAPLEEEPQKEIPGSRRRPTKQGSEVAGKSEHVPTRYSNSFMSMMPSALSS
ncbi:unnamed protein product [Effrenium voratum]|nr:unnamed protein product [Effrenium voratum]